MPGNDAEDIGGSRGFCSRLCTDKFDDVTLRSKSAALQSKDISKIDKEANIRGRWSKRIEFLLSCIGFAVGLGNVWRFPIKVYNNGGGTFLIPYFIFCLLIALPLLLLELGIGQFTGCGCTKVFKLVPVLFGIGWAQVMISSSIMIYYGVVMAWSIFYLFASFSPTLPWTVCTHEFNSKNCLGSHHSVNVNTTKSVPSTEEYYYRYVLGFEKLNGDHYSMDEYPGLPQWHLTLCLLLIWTIVCLSLMFGVKISGKIIYFSALYPYVALSFLIGLGCTLPGAKNGIYYYLNPDFSKLLEPSLYLSAIEQLFFSTSTAMGGMITFSSYNNFHDNIYRDSVIVVFADFFTSFFAGFAVFPILGNMAYRSNKEVKDVVNGGAGLFFVTYPEALSTIAVPNLWTILFMLMALSLGMDSQFAMMETVITALGDAFILFRKSEFNKAVLVAVLCVIFFFLGILLVTPGGIYYFDVLDVRVSGYGLPIIALLECIAVGVIYGFKKFQKDLRMMLGFSLNIYWFFMMGTVLPIIIFLILLGSIIQSRPINVFGKDIPIWGECLAGFFLFLVVFPIFFGFIFIALKYKKRYANYSTKEYLKTLITPPIYYGPHYKANWLLSTEYEAKLLLYKDDPKFLSHVPDVENIDDIVKAAFGLLDVENNDNDKQVEEEKIIDDN